jgi:hypothetical protein
MKVTPFEEVESRPSSSTSSSDDENPSTIADRTPTLGTPRSTSIPESFPVSCSPTGRQNTVDEVEEGEVYDDESVIFVLMGELALRKPVKE